MTPDTKAKIRAALEPFAKVVEYERNKWPEHYVAHTFQVRDHLRAVEALALLDQEETVTALDAAADRQPAASASRREKSNDRGGERPPPAAPPPPDVEAGRAMDDDQIRRMVDRFLCWKLPENFSPDGGISFKATFNEHTLHPMKHEPSGTNLFDATQAEAMVRYIIEGLPPPARLSAPPEEGQPEGMETTAGRLQDWIGSLDPEDRELVAEVAALEMERNLYRKALKATEALAKIDRKRAHDADEALASWKAGIAAEETNAEAERDAALSAQRKIEAENARLSEALIYVAYSLHSEPQYMLCAGVTLSSIPGYRVTVKLADGSSVSASIADEEYFRRRSALAAEGESK